MKKIVGLDSLRLIAFLAIFVYHSWSGFPYGYLGVDFFFVLSSFLLTYLAYRELDKTGTFSRKNFFIRRALRIFPLYYLIIGATFLLLPLLSAPLHIDPQLPQKKWLYTFFLSNYEQSDCLYYLKFYWSIAVEEQFYLLFLVLSVFFRRNPYIIPGFLLIIYALAMLADAYVDLSPYLSTVSHFPNFALGMLAGYLFFAGKDLKHYPHGLAVLSLVSSILTYETVFFDLSISLFFASIILLTISYAKNLEGNALFRLTEKLGTYTYGLYMYSGIVMTLTGYYLTKLNPGLAIFLNLILIIAVAATSYHLFEKRFLSLKNKFRSANT